MFHFKNQMHGWKGLIGQAASWLTVMCQLMCASLQVLPTLAPVLRTCKLDVLVRTKALEHRSKEVRKATQDLMQVGARGWRGFSEGSGGGYPVTRRVEGGMGVWIVGWGHEVKGLW